PAVALVVRTGLAVSYELMRLDAIRDVVKRAHDRGAPVYVDDAGGARVAPAAFDHPRMLELGVDIGATGLDKYGTIGPRFGLMAGDRAAAGRTPAQTVERGLAPRLLLSPTLP